MRRLFFGDIKPEGYFLSSIKKDMDGCIGNLEHLAPSILCDEKIYGKDRLTLISNKRDLGRIPDEKSEIPDIEIQYQWWNSESQSNWRDGYLRSAFLLEDESLCKKAHEYIEEILSTQDEDGYLGIYGEDLRYKHLSENGELWSKSTLFRVLLGYYEKTKDERVKNSLIRAVDNLMESYPKDKSNPFNVENSFSGHCHGLTIVDTLNELYNLTLDTKYLDYAVWLYENFSLNNVSEEDMKINNIEDSTYFWKSHGVHTYEHLRAVIIAAYHTPKYMPLLDKVMAKLPFYLTPSSAPIGDEWIFGRTANATKTGYEFCSILELFDSFALLLEKSGDISIADKMEWLYFNAGLGMKHPKESSIMYCKTDNCYSANRKRTIDDIYIDERYKYSPTHQTTAVCCVPNMGRLTPHYIQNMYLKDEYGFTAVLFGSSILNTKINDTSISIRQITNYPENLSIQFEIKVEKNIKFTLNIRKPKWASKINVDCDFLEQSDKIIINREWENTQFVTVSFECDIKFKTDFCKDYFVTRGPLVYALPIDSIEHLVHSYDLKPFREVSYESTQRDIENLKIHENSLNTFIYNPSKDGNLMTQSIIGTFFDGKNFKELKMIPMYNTILRKVTFEVGLNNKK